MINSAQNDVEFQLWRDGHQLVHIKCMSLKSMQNQAVRYHPRLLGPTPAESDRFSARFFRTAVIKQHSTTVIHAPAGAGVLWAKRQVSPEGS